MNRLTLYNRTEVLPALHPRSVTPTAPIRRPDIKVEFQQRTTRKRRFPVEQSLENAPQSMWLGQNLDIEV